MDAARRQGERNARRAVIETELARLSTEPFATASARAGNWAVIAGELRALRSLADPDNGAAAALLDAVARLVAALRGSDRPAGQAALGLVGEGLHDFEQLCVLSAPAGTEDLTGVMEQLILQLTAAAPEPGTSLDARLEAFGRPEPARSRRRAAAALAAEGATRLEAVWSGLADYVRRQGEALGKRVELVATGGELEVSGRAGEALRPALVQLIRNACAHGVETPAARQGAGKPGLAILRLSARRSGDRVEVTLADDGRGVCAARASASGERGDAAFAQASGLARASAFFAGFDEAGGTPALSTTRPTSPGGERADAPESSRAGLDLVRGAVEDAGGHVALSSTPGRGAAFTLTLPAPFAQAPARAVGARSAA